VDCATCREALSARLDGEAEPAPAEETDAHLAACATCRSWQVRAEAITRTLRVRPAVTTPDLRAKVLPAIDRHRWWPRVALGGVAIAQLALGMSQVFGMDDGMTTSAMPGGVFSGEHLLNESTAWNLALGLGLLWVALRTKAVTGMLPVLTGFLAVLTVFTVHDLIVGDVTVARVASHGLLVVGLGLLYVVAHQDPQRRHPIPDGARRPVEPADHRDDADHPRGGRPSAGGQSPTLRPAGRRAA
jgi:predicted anti-sigma-YlaC factor YlaD